MPKDASSVASKAGIIFKQRPTRQLLISKPCWHRKREFPPVARERRHACGSRAATLQSMKVQLLVCVTWRGFGRFCFECRPVRVVDAVYHERRPNQATRAANQRWQRQRRIRG